MITAPLRLTLLLTTLCTSILMARAATQTDMSPTLVILNAFVHTMDTNHPTASAIAVFGNKIAAVGDTAEIAKLAGPNTRKIDAAGKLVLPGFNDSHTHFLMGGYSLSSVDLRDATTP